MLKLTRNRDKQLIERATLVVEEFIAERRLYIYGGTAIDFALRTRGKNIYDDVTLKYADYDFYSANIIADSFELGMRLRTRMATDDIQIINAVHMRTLKVSIDGHFIADISYCPQVVLDRIPTLAYKTIAGNDVLVVAPHYQAIDMHSALSQPFDNPPMEVFNQRMQKDITRFNMLYDEFLRGPQPPSTPASHKSDNSGDTPQTPVPPPLRALIDNYSGAHEHKLSHANIESARPMYVGLVSAFALLKLAKGSGFTPRTQFDITIGASDDVRIQFVGGEGPYAIEIFASETLHDITHHRLLDIFPEYHLDAAKRLIIYNADKFLYPAFTVGKNNATFMCVQGSLKQMMAKYVFTGDTFYLSVYFDLIDALAHVENKYGATASDPHLKPFLTGTTIWPAATAPNLAMSTLYNLYIHTANIEDRVAGDSAMPRVKAALANRPPGLRFGDRNFEQRSQEFLAWHSDKRFFMVDGEPRRAI